MEKITIELLTSNAAFDGENRASEIARILRDVAQKIENGQNLEKLRDINGNAVGSILYQ